MKKTIFFILLAAFYLLVGTPCFSQGTWTQKANFGGLGRSGAASFTIGTNAYAGTGNTGSAVTQDFWQWNQCTNTWTQIADFPGAARAADIGFSIGNQGYVGLGCTTSATNDFTDFYKYDPASNTWTKKADFIGSGRENAACFAIGGKGYVGTGYNGSSTKDFYEYDTTTDAWTQKADFGGQVRRDAVGFAVNGEGYIGTGYNGSTMQDFWEYDPSTDTWTKKSNFGGTQRNIATAFVIGNNAYVGLGNNIFVQFADWWVYNAPTDTWTPTTAFTPGARGAAVGFSIGCKGYVALGINANDQQDLWEYDDPANSAYCITSSPVNVSPNVIVCNGQSTVLNATGGNPANYSWSPAAGLSSTNTANPVANPTITTQYILTDSGGACIQGVVADTVLITVLPAVILNVIADTTICSGQSLMLNPTGLSSFSYIWSPATNLNCTTCANPVATPMDTVTYTVIAGNGTCSDTAQVKINLGSAANAGIITAVRDTICQGTRGNLTLTGNSNNTIQWQSSATQGNFTNNGIIDTTHYQTNPLLQTTYYRVVVGSGSCIDTSQYLQLFVPPTLTANFGFTDSANTITFSDSSIGNIISYSWTFGDGATSYVKNPIHTYLKTDTTYNVCLTIYDGSNCSYTFCKDVGVATGIAPVPAQAYWTIYPNPFNGELFINRKVMNEKIKSIEIYDVLGRIMLNLTPGEIDKSINTLRLNVSSFAEGMYFLKIQTDNANYIERIIKQ